MPGLSFCTGLVSSYSVSHSDASHRAVTLAGTDPENEISVILNRGGATMENYLLLASTVRGGCCVFPSVFLRVFLAAGARRLRDRAGAVRGVTPLSTRVSRRGPSLSHGSWPLPRLALGASQGVFSLL